MSLPSSGAISAQDIQTEFKGSPPFALNNYYAGGARVPKLFLGGAGIPSSGNISFADFRGTQNPSISANGFWGTDSSAILGTTISNPASDGAGTVVFRTSTGSQHITYRSTDAGRSFQRVDPAQTLSGLAGQMFYANGYWVYNVGNVAYYSSSLPSFTSVTWPALPSSGTSYHLAYYWDHTGAQSAYKSVNTSTYTTVSEVSYQAVSGGFARVYTVTATRNGYYETYYNKPDVYVPPRTTVTTYQNVLSLPARTITTGTVPFAVSSGSFAGKSFRVLGGIIYYSYTGGTEAGFELLVDGVRLDYTVSAGTFYYSAEFGYAYVIPKYLSYNGTSWDVNAGISVWVSPTGFDWSFACSARLSDLYAGQTVPTSVIPVVMGKYLVLVPPPINSIPNPAPTLVSENGATFTSLPHTLWTPGAPAWSGACSTGSSIVAVSLAMRAALFP